MIFLVLIGYGLLAGAFVAKRKIKMSQAVIPLLAFALVATIALGQNYTVSVVADLNDGIGITNFLAAFLLPSKGWTSALFLARFEQYLILSLAMIIFYIVALVLDAKMLNK